MLFHGGRKRNSQGGFRWGGNPPSERRRNPKLRSTERKYWAGRGSGFPKIIQPLPEEGKGGGWGGWGVQLRVGHLIRFGMFLFGNALCLSLTSTRLIISAALGRLIGSYSPPAPPPRSKNRFWGSGRLIFMFSVPKSPRIQVGKVVENFFLLSDFRHF